MRLRLRAAIVECALLVRHRSGVKHQAYVDAIEGSVAPGLRTDQAAVRLEKISTPVLIAPHFVSSACDANVKTSGCIAR